MSNSISNSGQVLTLPEGLWWSDELSWQPVVRTVTWSVTGRPILQSGRKTGGRPITIEPIGGGLVGLISRADCDTLNTWASDPATELTLTWAGAAMAVRWAYDSSAAFSATPLYANETDQAGDLFAPRLRLIQL